MRLVDLTRPLGPGTRVYPGDPPVTVEEYALHRRDGYYARRICLPEHAGTHVDAPLHFTEGGLDAASLPAWRLIAPALVLGPLRGRVTAGALASMLRGCRAEVLRGWIILVKGEPVLDEGAARLLLDAGASGLGVETMSPDEEPYPVHRLLLPHGIAIIENLDLSPLRACERLTLFIGMLRLAGGSGAPARVLGLLDGGALGASIWKTYGRGSG